MRRSKNLHLTAAVLCFIFVAFNHQLPVGVVGFVHSRDLRHETYRVHRYAQLGPLHKPGGYYANITHHANATVYPDSIAANLPECPQLNLSARYDGKIYKSESGHFFFEPNQCRLRRLTSEQAAKCLAGKRIAFLGDSVTRYQYTSLLHFLAAGRYQHPYDDGQRSVTNKNQWGGW